MTDTVLFRNAAATVRAGPPSPSAAYVVSLLNDPLGLGPFRGAAVQVHAATGIAAGAWDDLAGSLRDHAAASRAIAIMSSGPAAAAAAQELGHRLNQSHRAAVWMLAPGAPPHRLDISDRSQVIFDPAQADQAAAAAQWAAAGAVPVPVPGAGPWPKFLLDLPGAIAALVASGHDAGVTSRHLRRTMRRGRAQSAYLLMMLGQRLRGCARRRAAAEAVLQRACLPPSPLSGPICFELGETRMELGRPAAAVEAYRAALGHRPNVAWYWLRASLAAFEAAGCRPQDADQAAFATTAVTRALSLDPGLAPALAHRDRLAAAGLRPTPRNRATTLATSPSTNGVLTGSGAEAARIWWRDLSRQEFAAVRAALALQDAARPEDAAAIAELLEQVRTGRLPPDRLTMDAILNCMCKGLLLRLRDATLEVASRSSLKVLAEELLVFDEYHFETSNPRPFVIDGGVNFGMSLYSTKAQYPDARIVGFEPNPEMCDLARANIRRNGWTEDIVLHQAALSAQNGRATLLIAADDDMAASLGTRLLDTGRPVTPVEVDTLRLSRFLCEPVDFLKLDIEGPEHEVLGECEAELALVETLFCEYHHSPGLQEDRLGRITGILWRAGFDSHITRSPWMERKYARWPGQAVRQNHSLSIYGRKRAKGQTISLQTSDTP